MKQFENSRLELWTERALRDTNAYLMHSILRLEDCQRKRKIKIVEIVEVVYFDPFVPPPVTNLSGARRKALRGRP